MILTVTPNPLLDYILHESIPPAPGGHRCRHLDWTVGGKGINVARMLKTLGRPALAFGFAGGANGERIRQRLRAQGISSCLIETEAETRTGINLVIDEPPHQNWWIEDGEELHEAEVATLVREIGTDLPRARFLAMSGTIPGRSHRDLYRRILDQCASWPGESYLDARGEPLQEALRAGGFFLKHNRDETCETFDLDPADPAQLPQLLEVLARHRVWGALITDGPRPALLWDGKTLEVLHPPVIREVSAVGSGDAALAGLLYARAEGLSLREAARWALAAGAADACHPGPCMASGTEVHHLVSLMAAESLFRRRSSGS
jgi:1-phosphofructokinase family hexose kinase